MKPPSHTVWAAAVRAVVSGDAPALDALLARHGPELRAGPPPYTPRGPVPSYEGGDARAIIARENFFASWKAFAAHDRARKKKGSPTARFEAAVDAIVAGDLIRLRRFLRADPRLVRARSKRTHHAMLLHYVGANGVEGFRQRTPKNAVAIAEALLAAGADVNAVADMYGGATTLGLVATSIHPQLAGVQDELIVSLLEHGARRGGQDSAGNGMGLVVGCLANGQPRAAALLAGRGVPIDLEGAAGLGRLAEVKRRLSESTPRQQIERGMRWACRYGRTAVVRFLLDRGAKATRKVHGVTPLHWAAFGGHPEVVRLLLQHKAGVNRVDDRYGGTPLEWSQHGRRDAPAGHRRSAHAKVETLLVAAGAKRKPQTRSDS